MSVFLSAMVSTLGNCSLTSSQSKNARCSSPQSATKKMARRPSTRTAYWTERHLAARWRGLAMAQITFCSRSVGSGEARSLSRCLAEPLLVGLVVLVARDRVVDDREQLVVAVLLDREAIALVGLELVG